MKEIADVRGRFDTTRQCKKAFEWKLWSLGSSMTNIDKKKIKNIYIFN